MFENNKNVSFEFSSKLFKAEIDAKTQTFLNEIF